MTKQMEGQMSLFDLDIWCGKTCQEVSVQTKEKTSDVSSKKPQESSAKMPLFLNLQKESGLLAVVLWETDGASLGEYTMHSFGEYPNAVKESRLSQILEDKPHPKYSLSAKACQGILNRARRRGKTLPKQLEEALITQSVSKNELDVRAEAKESLFNMNEQELCQPKTINQSYSSNENKVICIEGNGARGSHKGNGYRESDTMYTLNTVEQHAVAYGVDCYNQTQSEEVSKSLNSAATDSDHVPCVYSAEKTTYRKQGHPQNSEQAQGWEQTDVNDTLNAFDTGEVRTPTLVVENHSEETMCVVQDAYDKLTESQISASIKASGGNYGGGSEALVIQSELCVQETTKE